MCTAMLYDPADHYQPEETAQDFKQNSKLYERFMKIKQSKLLSLFRKKDVAIGGSAGLKPKSFLQQFFNF
jgi:hypothetical protein